MEKKKDGRANNGGKRAGSGQKKKPYETKTISFRVRSDIKDALKVILDPIVKREEMKLINDKNRNDAKSDN